MGSHLLSIQPDRRNNDVKYLEIISPANDWVAKRSARTGEEFLHSPALKMSLWVAGLKGAYYKGYHISYHSVTNSLVGYGKSISLN